MKVYVGIDAHTTNFTLATSVALDEDPVNVNTYPAKVSNIAAYCKNLRKKYGKELEIVTGYEAGTLGFSLKRELDEKGIACIVIAPSTIAGTNLNRKRKKKTDKRDAMAIAKCLMTHDYSEVYMPDEEDEAVRDLIRMRQDLKKFQKSTKQQIGALCHRHGYHFNDGKYWTKKHLKWLRDLPIEGILKDSLEGYLRTLDYLTDRVTEIDSRIDEISEQDKYRESVHKLTCLKGIKTFTALAVIVEIGDFSRFIKAKNFAAFLGLVSGENSSSDGQTLLGITKQGNRFLRRLLTEAAKRFSVASTKKSKELLRRQKGNSEHIIAYADKANDRLRKRYYHLVMHNKKCANKATTAVARELACFIWGMMTDNTQTVLS